ncbi:hypothetical protein PRZ48_013581 [Zasmidium cellare]|uniref:Uncharacterized protein n=1 Tax=Zasmidium cellare TaxID=395010 RepID=A0ABR0E1F3_ZASCE|nr:hypothetical protein PRZ48_013581 [Zasmidium cellare]
MQFLAATVALFGLAAALPGAPTSDCHTTKTCSAVYHHSTKTIPYQAVKTVTVTDYKPVTHTTEVVKQYTVTSYVPSTYYSTSTWIETQTKSYTTSTVSTICTTTTIPVVSSYTTCLTSSSTCPISTSYPTTITQSTSVPSTYTTSTACPKEEKKTYSTYSTSICTETSTQCAQKTQCTAKAYN